MTRFRHLEIEDPLDPPTAEELAAVEEAVGARLPGPFVEFLATANGGRLDYSFDVPAGDGVLRMVFWSVLSTRRPLPGVPAHGKLLHEIEAERRLRGAGRHLLPFATDGGASVVYLDLSPEGYGRVVAFIEGLPQWTGVLQSALVTLAPDFDGFVSALYLNLEEERFHPQ